MNRQTTALFNQKKIRRRRNWLLLIGGILVGAAIVLALVGLVYVPHNPVLMHPPDRGLGPTSTYLLGTDQFGRDILSRIMRGASSALLVGLIAVGIGLSVGVPLGTLAGFVGQWTDEIIMRVMDALFAFPAILLAIAIVGMLGPGLGNTMIAIGIAYVPIFARLARAGVLSQKSSVYVEAAQSIGCSTARLLWKHILPNSLSPLIVQATITFGGAILAEAALSYLGLGVQPPEPSWGQMLNDAANYLSVAPWLAVFPGVMISLAVLGFNLLGDGLRDQLDPQRRTRAA